LQLAYRGAEVAFYDAEGPNMDTLEAYRDPLVDAYRAAACTATTNPYSAIGVARSTARATAPFRTIETALEGNPDAHASQVAVLREIIGNPFRPVTIDPAWHKPSVASLAQAIDEERAFDRMPILADALEDAGCTSHDMLSHCRGPGPHFLGCWVVDMILGKT